MHDDVGANFYDLQNTTHNAHNIPSDQHLEILEILLGKECRSPRVGRPAAE